MSSRWIAEHISDNPLFSFQINFKVTTLSATPTVHGVLGQTYRETAKTYQKLANGPEYKKLRANGMPFFVDGEEEDYQTSGIMAADCKFARFALTESTVSVGGRKLLGF